MGFQKFCDVCGLMRLNKDGEPSVHRYGLSRQMPNPGKTRRNGNPAYRRFSHYGGIDLCDECFDRIATPKMRPDLRGKTGPKPDLTPDA